ncbi:MAG: hypothetical protein M0P39_05645 [Rhodocyclaceae bacterium]|nr:hypothetical protein [Rhodocyclaceae bacterium]
MHGKCLGRECRAELIVIDGVVTEVRYGAVVGRVPLAATELRYFKEIVGARADEIVARWIDFFVLHKTIESEVITRRLA